MENTKKIGIGLVVGAVMGAGAVGLQAQNVAPTYEKASNTEVKITSATTTVQIISLRSLEIQAQGIENQIANLQAKLADINDKIAQAKALGVKEK